MATRSRIGIQLKDNSVLSVYHHWDGYPEWLGRILTTHYNSREQVADLIDGGDMSSCWNDTVWGEDRTDGNKYGPEYYSARGEIALLVLMTSLSILTRKIMKSMLISGQ